MLQQAILCHAMPCCIMVTMCLPPPMACHASIAAAASTAVQLAGDVPPVSTAKRLDQLEIELIERVMREVGGNLSAAARTLGVSRNRLYRKLGRAGGAS